MSEVTIELTVNGRKKFATVPARTTLADLLRDRFHLTGTHLGCEQGVCGACTVLVDELPMRSCLVLAASCQGTEVVTVEGLDGPDADRVRAAFSHEGALQCGFCTPGMLLAAHDLVRRREALTRDEVCVALAGNICRCTGYNGIVRAVQSATAEGIEAEGSATVH
ncbi:(2Fe-2S)-binding protein [Amycolatopsis rubida]|uniref:(2Fe-2S)-binding protein n=1 Tax=Amycolatopsis rubida TaxID=112413 RepID=A0ABX0BSK0_9PSEU|nr:(2Fe-2S)-binding protein [Amycolatopsis sp. M39]MYW92116.1 2Fe-2S iron-sulfur cluster binding domain-containing protein [Amycolatopsis rubida]NEC57102.1 (2Fe-2S)-binding protein [Amycolatopsis rubida]OAP27718.1 Carbon monoxide dehydrogenase small chain [Amycolatopsis sp. M39]